MSKTDDLTVKMQCLCNGVIATVNDSGDAAIADKFAIGTLPPNDHPDVENFYRSCFENELITNQFICHRRHQESFEKCLQDCLEEIPEYLFLSESPFEGIDNGILCAIVKNSDQVHEAIRNDAKMIICSDELVFRDVGGLIRHSNDLIPLFVEVDSLEQATGTDWFRDVDGLLVNSLPTAESNQIMYEQIVRRDDELPKPQARLVIGVLAHQGDYKLHYMHFQEAVAGNSKSNVEVRLVRSVPELKRVDGLLMPGGWSNLQTEMLKIDGLGQRIKRRVDDGMPLVAVCAGMILARKWDGENGCKNRVALDLIEMAIENNLLEGSMNVAFSDSRDSRMHVFSNGPYATKFDDSRVKKLAWIDDPASKFHGKNVGVQQGNVFAFAFHEGIHGDFIGFVCQKLGYRT